MSELRGNTECTPACGHSAERGAVSMSLMVVVGILLLAFALLVSLRIAMATDEASRLQSAADAAALAGAQSILDDAPGQIVSALVTGQVIPGSLGQKDAADFANRNDTTLVSYHYSPLQDRVVATVRSNAVLESGEREERSAVAELGASFGACDPPDEPPTPSTTSSTSSSPSSPSSSSSSSSTTSSTTPVDDVADTLTCGPLDIPVTWEWSEDDGWAPDFEVNASLIQDLGLEPALID